MNGVAGLAEVQPGATGLLRLWMLQVRGSDLFRFFVVGISQKRSLGPFFFAEIGVDISLTSWDDWDSCSADLSDAEHS